MLLVHNIKIMRISKIYNRGFTMLEVVISIAILSMMTLLIAGAFTPYMQFKQRMETTTKLNDLADAMMLVYRKYSASIDGQDRPGTAMLGSFVLDPNLLGERFFETSCASFNGVATSDITDINDPTTSGMSIYEVLTPLAPYARQSISSLSEDGYGNAVCVLVSNRAVITHSGQPLFYHSIAFISPGQNNIVDVGTNLVVSQPNGNDDVWNLTLSGDDKGILVDGSQIAIANFEKTKARLDRLARAYETYFNIRFRARSARDNRFNFNYFYASTDTTNSLNGEPHVGFGDIIRSTDVTPPEIGSYWALPTIRTLGNGWGPISFSNVLESNIWRTLGVSDGDLYDAWGQPILFDNMSNRVRSGIDNNGNRRPPPFSATFGALLPGHSSCTGDPNDPTSDCPQYLTSTAVSAN